MNEEVVNEEIHFLKKEINSIKSNLFSALGTFHVFQEKLYTLLFYKISR